MGKIIVVMYWVGLGIILVGSIMGLLSDLSYLSHNSFSLQSLALLFGQVASPIWEGLALIAGSIIIKHLYGDS